MLDKNEKYHLILMKNLTHSFNYIYTRDSKELDEDDCKEYLQRQIEKFQELLERFGICYDGDIEVIILSGERAIDYSLVRRIEPIANDNDSAKE